jgi:hypothetical protein
MNDKKIEATVSYTGHDDYQGEFSPEVPVGTVKRKAMDKFEIEPSAARTSTNTPKLAISASTRLSWCWC